MKDNELIEMLLEGGNSWAGKRKADGSFETEEVINKKGKKENKALTKGQAQKMDMTRVQRGLLKKEFLNTFKKLNDLVKKESGEPLWNDFSVVTSGLAFNGSSTWLFHDDISDDDFVKHKKKVGDIDVTVPSNRMIDLFDVLLKYEEKMIGNIEYIGNNRPSASANQQINAVFKFEVPGTDYIAYPQVDFEPSDYENDKPTEWDSFSHNSDWTDIQKGFKGVNHKYAMTIVAHIISKDFSKLPTIMLDTGADKTSFWETTENVGKTIGKLNSKDLPKKETKGYDEDELLKTLKTENSRIRTIRKKSGGTPVKAGHYISFSVGRGVRLKYKSALTKDGKPIMIDGKMLLIAVDSKNAKYEKQLKPIFKLFFGYDPEAADLKKMNSFVGVIDLLKKTKLKNKKDQYKQFLFELIQQKLWGHSEAPHGYAFYTRSQELERDSKEIDAEIKWAMVNYIMDELKVGDLNEIKDVANSYYETWVGGADDSIRESFIPYGSKFSAIFETVESVNKSKLVKEPRGWKHFDEKRLTSEKVKMLKGFDILSNQEIVDFMNSMPNSRNVNDVIRKIKVNRGVEDFLRFQVQEKSVTKQAIENMIKRGY